MKFSTIRIAGAAALLALGAPAFAQQIAVGTPIVDLQGGEVGTVASAGEGYITVKTDKHEARLAENSFTKADGKLLFGMTRDQLNAAIESSNASAQAKLVAGASVSGAQGAKVGTIDSIDDQFATLKLNSGKLVKIPRSGIAPGPEGAVIGLSAEALEAQAGAAAPTTEQAAQ